MRLLFTVLIPVILSGCYQTTFDSGSRGFSTLLEESTKVLKELPCEKAVEPAVNDIADYDFACIADQYNHVILLMNHENGDVKRVRLVWNDYEEGQHLRDQNSKELVKPFIDFVNRHYLAAKQGYIEDLFFNGLPEGHQVNNWRFANNGLNFRYEIWPRDGVTVHRLEIKEHQKLSNLPEYKGELFNHD